MEHHGSSNPLSNLTRKQSCFAEDDTIGMTSFKN
jgi:hypothetical protein